ncbi:MAG: hypothetical protein J6U54_05355 [Clostridiales bacterium]|nr:hypothetical protein [Clostridiales bacterium]
MVKLEFEATKNILTFYCLMLVVYLITTYSILLYAPGFLLKLVCIVGLVNAELGCIIGIFKTVNAINLEPEKKDEPETMTEEEWNKWLEDHGYDV